METIAFGGGDDEGGGRRPRRSGDARFRPAGDGAADDRGETRSGGGWKGEGRREEGAASNRGNASGRRANARSNPPRSERRPRLPRPARPRPGRGVPPDPPPGSAPDPPGVANPGSARVANPGSARVANPGSARVATLVATLKSRPRRVPTARRRRRGARGSTRVQTGPAALESFPCTPRRITATWTPFARPSWTRSRGTPRIILNLASMTFASPEDSPLAALDACGTRSPFRRRRRRRAAVIALLDDDRWDYPVEARSGGGWTALQEATHMGSRWMTRRLFAATLDRSKREFERKRPRLVEAVRNMPDFRAKMHWEFGSAVFGPVLRMYAPSDTYEITKRGAALRVDGTLRGMDDERDELGQPKNRSLLPRWKRRVFASPRRRRRRRVGGSRRRRDLVCCTWTTIRARRWTRRTRAKTRRSSRAASANASRLRRTNSSAAVRRRRSIAPTT